MSDVASAVDLPDVESLQAAPPPELPDVGTLKAPFQPTPSRVPQAFANRISQGSAFDRIYSAAAGAFKEGAAAVDIPSDVMLRDIQDVGLGPKPGAPPSFANGLRYFSQSLLHPMAMAGNFVNQVLHGAKEAAVAGTTQAAIEAGVEPNTAGQVGAAVGSTAEYLTTDLSIWNHLGRVEVDGTSGALRDIRIGALPRPEEVPAQAAQIAEHYGVPDAAPAIQKAYDAGVLPAEIFHDAQRDPSVLADLVEGKVPEAYPVSDWTGGAAEAPAKGAEGAAAEGAPAKPPVIPTRLRPIEGTGELTPMQLSQSVEEAVGRVFDKVPASRVAENDVQGRAASTFWDKDPDWAKDVIMAGKSPPKNLLAQAVFNEGIKRATAAGDFDTVRMMATQGAMPGMLKRFGQEIQIASQLGPEGETAGMIQQVQEKRVADLKAQGIDAPKAINDQVAASQQITRQARIANAQPSAWADLINLITCKE